MVGASGALFGLAGALVGLHHRDRLATRDSQGPVVRAVLGLVALNLVLWWAMDGQLAWETHLGGFLTGWGVAIGLDRRAERRLPPPA
jgi:membrane associated rhomboid family serine protease